MGKPLPRNTKISGAFFGNDSFWFSSSWNSFHIYPPPIWIFVIILVKNKFREMTGEMCEKDFNKKWKSQTLLKQHEHFLI